VLIAIGNSNAPEMIGSARALLADPSPVVRDAAQCALAELDAAQS